MERCGSIQGPNILQSSKWYVVWCGWKIGFRVKGVEKARKRDYKGPQYISRLFCFVLVFFFLNILNDKKPSEVFKLEIVHLYWPFRQPSGSVINSGLEKVNLEEKTS